MQTAKKYLSQCGNVVLEDQEKTVIQPVHHQIVPVFEINAFRGDQLRYRNMADTVFPILPAVILSYLKIAPVNLQFKIISKKADIAEYIVHAGPPV